MTDIAASVTFNSSGPGTDRHIKHAGGRIVQVAKGIPVRSVVVLEDTPRFRRKLDGTKPIHAQLKALLEERAHLMVRGRHCYENGNGLGNWQLQCEVITGSLRGMTLPAPEKYSVIV